MTEALRDGRSKNWWWAGNELIDDSHVASMGLASWAVYSVLLRFCDANGRAFPSFSTIEKLTGLSRQGVSNAIAKLIDLGYISRVKKGGEDRGSNVYEVKDLADVVTPSDKKEGSQLSRPGVVYSVDQGSQLSRPGVVNSVDSKKTYLKKTNLRRKERGGSEAEHAAIASQDFQETLGQEQPPSEIPPCQQSDRLIEASSPQPPSSAVPPSLKKSSSKKRRPDAASVYPTLRDLETFEKCWEWYRDKGKDLGFNPGDKVLAAIAWRDTLEPCPDLMEDFRKGASLFFRQTKVGIPHLNRFIAGAENHPTPYWQSALDAASTSSNGGDFIQGTTAIAPLPAYAPATLTTPEINTEEVKAGIARARALALQGVKHGS